MKGTFIDIRLEGDKFSPKKLRELTNLPLEAIAEYGEVAQTGRYKGKPSPYGMALIKVDGTDEENFNKIISQYLSLLAQDNKRAIKESGVDDIIIDVETLPNKETNFSFNPEIIQEISKLKGRIDFQTIEEDAEEYSLEDWDFILNKEEFKDLIPKRKARKIENLIKRKKITGHLTYIPETRQNAIVTNNSLYGIIYIITYFDKEEKDTPSFEKFKRKILTHKI